MKTETEQIYKERILRVLRYIQGHLDEPLSLDELAGIAYFSPFHFHRIFRGVVGESVKEHIRRLRLERAVSRLRLTDQSILNIALDTGYESHESFSRAFKTMFGATPSVIRRDSYQINYQKAASGVHFSPGSEVADFQPLRAVAQINVAEREAIMRRFQGATTRHTLTVCRGGATRKGLIRSSCPQGCVDFGLILRYARSEYRRGYSFARVPWLSLKIGSNSAHVGLSNSP